MVDIALAYKQEPIVIFDLTRTQADKMDHVYALIEGRASRTAGCSRPSTQVKLFPTPHVVVFFSLKCGPVHHNGSQIVENPAN